MRHVLGGMAVQLGDLVPPMKPPTWQMISENPEGKNDGRIRIRAAQMAAQGGTSSQS